MLANRATANPPQKAFSPIALIEAILTFNPTPAKDQASRKVTAGFKKQH